MTEGTLMMNKTKLSELLWRADLMNTCCTVNEGMENEYDGEARNIVERIAKGEDPRNAIIAVFNEYFWWGCLLEDSRKKAGLDRLIMEIESMEHHDEHQVCKPSRG
jgi:hypothetical protein